MRRHVVGAGRWFVLGSLGLLSSATMAVASGFGCSADGAQAVAPGGDASSPGQDARAASDAEAGVTTDVASDAGQSDAAGDGAPHCTPMPYYAPAMDAGGTEGGTLASLNPAHPRLEISDLDARRDRCPSR
jgi:hypothetical protein